MELYQNLLLYYLLTSFFLVTNACRYQIASGGNFDGWAMSMIRLQNGFPAVFYEDYATFALTYARAYDNLGSNWNTPRILDNGSGQCCVSRTLSGVRYQAVPAVVYLHHQSPSSGQSSGFKIKFLKAQDQLGTNWNSPQTVFIQPYQSFGVPSYISATVLPRVDESPTQIGEERVAVAFGTKPPFYAYYTCAMDIYGMLWSPYVKIEQRSVIGEWTRIVTLQDGLPGVAYYHYDVFPNTHNIRFMKALDWYGQQTWTSSVVYTHWSPLSHVSLALIGGNPAVAFSETGSKMGTYVLAVDPLGGGWNTNQYFTATLTSSLNGPNWMSLEEVHGLPAVAYDDAFGSMWYTRGSAVDGSGVWTTSPIIQLWPERGQHLSMVMIGNFPAVAYYSTHVNDPQYVRADDALGATWGVNPVCQTFSPTPPPVPTPPPTPPIVVPTASPLPIGCHEVLITSGRSGLYTSLITLANGFPAFFHEETINNELQFTRATDITGFNWLQPLSLDTGSGCSNTGFNYCNERTLCGVVLYNRPTVVYRRLAAVGSELMVMRANDYLGDTWNAPVLIKSVTYKAWFITATVLRNVFVANDERLAVAWNLVDTNRLLYAMANDADATNWPPTIPYADSAPQTGGFVRLITADDGLPLMAYLQSFSGANYIAITKGDNHQGTSWTKTYADTTADSSAQIAFTLINDYPCITFMAGNALRYRRSSTTDGQGAWWAAELVHGYGSLYNTYHNDIMSVKGSTWDMAGIVYYAGSGVLKFARRRNWSGVNSWYRQDLDTRYTRHFSAGRIAGHPAFVAHEYVVQEAVYYRADDVLGDSWNAAPGCVYDGTYSPTFAPTTAPIVPPTKLPTKSPTEVPTQAPTKQPTISPTDAPTAAPTKAPTDAPTQAPTKPPTDAPTKLPTKAPTDAPTQAPSKPPTDVPTKLPTKAPTDAPTQTPTKPPTDVPTRQPTKAPTDAPTQAPTKQPTDVPTRLPTKSPTDAPTQAPTKQPTDVPTRLPTKTPTDAPTQAPTKQPTDVPTRLPTKAPSDAPTRAPTKPPTDSPTRLPTKSPTDAPTSAPTKQPTDAPTMLPTKAPTDAPTQAPTKQPTDVPTKLPTKAPTDAPTEAPTEAPTRQPTDAPFAGPTKSPTKRPTAAPSISPTQQPTDAPTKLPTKAPTDAPTRAPSKQPTDVPTRLPTKSPTDAPTQAPTKQPTMSPSKPPTDVPTRLPTKSPTDAPTQAPTKPPTDGPTRLPTKSPTDAPTRAPTKPPTDAPTKLPTNAPTHTPTQAPTKLPTSTPTTQPSNAPSTQPSAAPSQSPTKRPTEAPFAGPTKSPTKRPTRAPTTTPTKLPTNAPTLLPSNSPSVAPTALPTTAPTVAPTSSPSQLPTSAPTVSPTQSPSALPTKAPSSSPTRHPTRQPTVAPTRAPSTSPTKRPTQAPFSGPTVSPTKRPTFAPTTAPSRLPTNVPTSQPSAAPTSLPTSAPTKSPTLRPSLAPSQSPTKRPTQAPFAGPTVSPTQAPSKHPTSMPSATPTGAPTHAPSTSPTLSPSQLPTLSPSESPTLNPSAAPSSSPTRLPSLSPSSSPTLRPSAAPTQRPTSAPFPLTFTELTARLQCTADNVYVQLATLSLNDTETLTLLKERAEEVSGKPAIIVNATTVAYCSDLENGSTELVPDGCLVRANGARTCGVTVERYTADYIKPEDSPEENSLLPLILGLLALCCCCLLLVLLAMFVLRRRRKRSGQSHDVQDFEVMDAPKKPPRSRARSRKNMHSGTLPSLYESVPKEALESSAHYQALDAPIVSPRAAVSPRGASSRTRPQSRQRSRAKIHGGAMPGIYAQIDTRSESSGGHSNMSMSVSDAQRAAARSRAMLYTAGPALMSASTDGGDGYRMWPTDANVTDDDGYYGDIPMGEYKAMPVTSASVDGSAASVPVYAGIENQATAYGTVLPNMLSGSNDGGHGGGDSNYETMELTRPGLIGGVGGNQYQSMLTTDLSTYVAVPTDEVTTDESTGQTGRERRKSRRASRMVRIGSTYATADEQQLWNVLQSARQSYKEGDRDSIRRNTKLPSIMPDPGNRDSRMLRMDRASQWASEYAGVDTELAKVVEAAKSRKKPPKRTASRKKMAARSTSRTRLQQRPKPTPYEPSANYVELPASNNNGDGTYIDFPQQKRRSLGSRSTSRTRLH